jgi:hypothetical protein
MAPPIDKKAARAISLLSAPHPKHPALISSEESRVTMRRLESLPSPAAVRLIDFFPESVDWFATSIWVDRWVSVLHEALVVKRAHTLDVKLARATIYGARFVILISHRYSPFLPQASPTASR